MELALTSTNERDSIRNGLINLDAGHRAVAFTYDPASSKKIVMRDMISICNTDKYYGWNASVQTLKVGDFVAIHSWGKGFRDLRLFRKGAKGLRPVRNYGGVYIKEVLSLLPKTILNFLAPRGGGPSYLPSGEWRSKYDMINTLDKPTIEAFLSQYLEGDWLTYAVEEALKAPRQHLITDWSSPHVKPLPNIITNHEEIWVEDAEKSEDYYVHNSMVWILLHFHGEKELVELEPTSGHFYVGKSRKIIKTYTGMPKALPSTVIKAVQINLGAYEKDERSYGARWFLYKR